MSTPTASADNPEEHSKHPDNEYFTSLSFAQRRAKFSVTSQSVPNSDTAFSGGPPGSSPPASSAVRSARGSGGLQALRAKFEQAAASATAKATHMGTHTLTRIAETVPAESHVQRFDESSSRDASSVSCTTEPPQLPRVSSVWSTVARAESAIARESTSDDGVALTPAEIADGVLLKVKCHLYRLENDETGQLSWIEAGSGFAAFQLDRRVDKIMLTMRHKRTNAVIMHHPVHPHIELQLNPNNNRSWIWTTSDFARLDSGKPTVPTFAIKFRSLTSSQLFYAKYNYFRDVNRIKDVQAQEELRTPGGATDVDNSMPAAFDDLDASALSSASSQRADISVRMVALPSSPQRCDGDARDAAGGTARLASMICPVPSACATSSAFAISSQIDALLAHRSSLSNSNSSAIATSSSRSVLHQPNSSFLNSNTNVSDEDGVRYHDFKFADSSIVRSASDPAHAPLMSTGDATATNVTEVLHDRAVVASSSALNTPQHRCSLPSAAIAAAAAAFRRSSLTPNHTPDRLAPTAPAQLVVPPSAATPNAVVGSASLSHAHSDSAPFRVELSDPVSHTSEAFPQCDHSLSHQPTFPRPHTISCATNSSATALRLPQNFSAYSRKATGFTDVLVPQHSKVNASPSPPVPTPTSPSSFAEHDLAPAELSAAAVQAAFSVTVPQFVVSASLSVPSPPGRRKRTTTKPPTSRRQHGEKKQHKIIKFFGANPPRQALLEQTEHQYEASNAVAKYFPRMKALRYVKQDCSPIHDPLPPNLDVEKCQSRINVLLKLREIAALDCHVLQTMADQLRAENSILESVKSAVVSPPVSASAQNDTLPIPGAALPSDPLPQYSGDVVVEVARQRQVSLPGPSPSDSVSAAYTKVPISPPTACDSRFVSAEPSKVASVGTLATAAVSSIHSSFPTGQLPCPARCFSGFPSDPPCLPEESRACHDSDPLVATVRNPSLSVRSTTATDQTTSPEAQAQVLNCPSSCDSLAVSGPTPYQAASSPAIPATSHFPGGGSAVKSNSLTSSHSMRWPSLLFSKDACPSDHIVELRSINQFFSEQLTSVALAVENLRRAYQFQMPKSKPRSQDASPPNNRSSVIRQLVNPRSLRSFTVFRDPPRDDEEKNKVLTFKVVKINKIRKNTIRRLDFDIAHITLTIYKNNKNEDDDTGLSHKEAVIGCKSVIAVEQVPKNDHELTLTFLLSGRDAIDKLDPDAAVRSPESMVKKTWRLLFDEPKERERFFRLMQIHVIASQSSDSESAPSLSQNKLRHQDNLANKSTNQTLHRLAAALHEIWCLEKREEGWLYNPVVNEARKKHPHMVPFDQLLPQQQAHYKNLATEAYASILSMGYCIEKRVDVADEEDEDAQYLGMGTIDTSLVQLVEHLAVRIHDAWVEHRRGLGWTDGPQLSYEQRTHPDIKPYHELPPSVKEMERNTAYRVIGSLLDWGFIIQKSKEDSGTR